MLTSKEKRFLIVIVIMILVIGGVVVYNQLDSSAVEIKQATSQPESTSQTKSKATKQSKETILVHVGGAVAKPGVYECKVGSRLYKVIEKAAGPTSQANLNGVNLAKSVRDGEQIIIPVQKSSESQSSAPSTATSSGQININTAGQEKLQQLSGIGPALADRIIKYRKEHNSFQSKGELVKVSGIGSKTMAKLKDQITY